MALHLPIGPLKTHSGLEPVPKCEPLADDISCFIEAGKCL